MVVIPTWITALLLRLQQNFKLMAYPTNPIYKFAKNLITNQNVSVKITVNSVESFIPIDEANTDYQEYLEWAKTNTAEAAD